MTAEVIVAAVTTTSFQKQMHLSTLIESFLTKNTYVVSDDSNVYVAWFTDKATPKQRIRSIEEETAH
jgi:hypothetical protein